MSVKCNWGISIANPNIANKDAHWEDLPYNQMLENDFWKNLEPKRGFGQYKLQYLIENMSTYDIAGIDEIVADILDYYEKNYELSSEQLEFTMNIRLFLHKKFKSIAGDADGTYIRLSIPQLVDDVFWNVAGFMKAEANKYASVIRNEQDIAADITLFDLKFRQILAHEMFHIIHYSSVGSKLFYADNRCNYILRECFADCFSYSYISSVIDEKIGANSLQHNAIFNKTVGLAAFEESRLFGVGRKKLLQGYYSQEEIAADGLLFENNVKCKKIVISEENNGLSACDYAGGYVLYRYLKKTGKRVGKECGEFTELYAAMLKGSFEECFYKIIEMK